MNPLAILLLGMAMSTDAFAAALGKGAGMLRPRLTEALRIGLIFGVVEAITPIVGWLLGAAAARFIQAWDHWIAFGLLAALGLHMIWKSIWGAEEEHEEAQARRNGLLALALTGLATSIDAMAVGVGLAFVDVNILVVAAVIGLCTFTMVTIGIMAGHVLGTVIGKRAETAGGVVLILVGATILYEHLHGAA
ncbi:MULTISPECIES: manganese efflux pump MntP family protein [Dyella]|uniref:Putative manganese efflux pump MntP n=2 Tax=Dyella TaxID=231454 RepID=A0A4R0YYL0_9GAMM|nr:MULTISPECIES: manganese efflux pump MntP family protein [Dyella]TBR40014.1 manganese efflux pump MntP family protein [Dyella terrae]TCI12404.1 manganese efflux pump MntP family protein [Dyella soli]